MLMSTFVFATAAWFTIRYHRKQDDQLTEHLAATHRGEAFIIVGLLSTFLLWWVIGFQQYVDVRDPPEGSEVVYVDAKQWMWKFAYADGRVSNDVLTVPVGRPIKLVMTSRDVIHSFFVPGFRVKQDVLPGRYTTLWFEAKEPGTYPIWCAEYCGVSHSLMRGEVQVLGADEYARWKRQGDVPPANADCGRGPGSCGDTSLVEQGRLVAERRQCVACHTLDGQKHIGPTWARPLRLRTRPRRRPARRRRRRLPHAVDDGAYGRRRRRVPRSDAVVPGHAHRGRDIAPSSS